MRTSSFKNSIAIGVSIVLGSSILSIGISNAAGSTITACAKKSSGAMRLITNGKPCKKSERTITWGSQGDSGATGATGAPGADAVSYFASFDLSGNKDTARSSSNIPNASVVSTGVYKIIFPNSMAGCTALATTIGNAGADIASVVYTSSTEFRVNVMTHGGSLNNSAFNFALFCN
jgi:hypothetical protein